MNYYKSKVILQKFTFILKSFKQTLIFINIKIHVVQVNEL